MTFPNQFSSVPTVVIAPTNDAFNIQVEDTSVTKTGFSGWAYNIKSTTIIFRGLYWIAIA